MVKEEKKWCFCDQVDIAISNPDRYTEKRMAVCKYPFDDMIDIPDKCKTCELYKLGGEHVPNLPKLMWKIPVCEYCYWNTANGVYECTKGDKKVSNSRCYRCIANGVETPVDCKHICKTSDGLNYCSIELNSSMATEAPTYKRCIKCAYFRANRYYFDPTDDELMLKSIDERWKGYGDE